MIEYEMQHVVGLACGIILLIRTIKGTKFELIDMVLFIISVGLLFV